MSGASPGSDDLVKAVAAATAECTALMNQQFLALIANDPDVARFTALIEQGVQKRRIAMKSLLEHIARRGW
jgi:hypothetical protein